MNGDTPRVADEVVQMYESAIWRPIETFQKHRGASTSEEINPHYILPKQGLVRLQKIMDEYAGGVSAQYTTNESLLNRGLELMAMFREDLEHLGARDQHELLRCWELDHRAWVAESHIRHLLHRKETRWPGYYYRSDYPNLDDDNWRVFVNSTYDSDTGRWDLFTKPYHQLIA